MDSKHGGPSGLDHSSPKPLRTNKAVDQVKDSVQAPQLSDDSAHPTSYKSTSDRHPWHKGGRKKNLEHRLKSLKDRVCMRHSKATKHCPDCGQYAELLEKRFDGQEQLDEKRQKQKAYFEKWRSQTKMKDRIIAYCRPEEKTHILLACEALNLSMKDFVISSCLESSKFVLDMKKGDKRGKVLRDEQMKLMKS